jgi:hypothetical protein
MTRDNVLWNILLGMGVVFGIMTSTITVPTDYGLTAVSLNWIRLGSLMLTALGGMFGNSPLSGDKDVKK